MTWLIIIGFALCALWCLLLYLFPFLLPPRPPAGESSKGRISEFDSEDIGSNPISPSKPHHNHVKDIADHLEEICAAHRKAMNNHPPHLGDIPGDGP